MAERAPRGASKQNRAQDLTIRHKRVQGAYKMVLTASYVLQQGLRFAGCSVRQQNTRVTTMIRRFKACYGSHPLVYARLWSDLERGDSERKLHHFFLCLYWLKCYATECVLACLFQVDEDTVRAYCWYYAECIQQLKDEKVSGLCLCVMWSRFSQLYAFVHHSTDCPPRQI